MLGLSYFFERMKEWPFCIALQYKTYADKQRFRTTKIWASSALFRQVFPNELWSYFRYFDFLNITIWKFHAFAGLMNNIRTRGKFHPFHAFVSRVRELWPNIKSRSKSYCTFDEKYLWCCVYQFFDSWHLLFGR